MRKKMKLLSNTTLLFVVTILSVINLMWYIVCNENESALSFVLLGFIAYFFSKNMIIVLLTPLLIVNVVRLVMISNSSSVREGFGKKTKGKETKEGKGKQMLEKKVLEKAYTQKKDALPITPATGPEGDAAADEAAATTTTTPQVDESFEGSRLAGKKKKYTVDYGSTIEDAYDQLNQIIGSDGIKRLTNDTQHLMKQQLQLAESMKDMGPMFKQMAPLMKQAQSLLGNIGGGANTGLQNVAQLAEKFSAK